jgi:hypothetical protein
LKKSESGSNSGNGGILNWFQNLVKSKIDEKEEDEEEVTIEISKPMDV